MTYRFGVPEPNRNAKRRSERWHELLSALKIELAKKAHCSNCLIDAASARKHALPGFKENLGRETSRPPD